MTLVPAPVRNVIAALWTWAVLVGGIILIFPFVLVWRFIGWPVDRMNYAGGRLFRIVGATTARVTPRWNFSVRGPLPPNPRNPYIVVANHESFADILLLCFLPWEMKWLSKVENMWVPVLGWLMWAVRDIGVKRGRAVSAKHALAECRKRLEGRVSVIIFPEGTRSPDQEMLPFKDGAFRLAKETGIPILPVVIVGTRNALVPHDWRINKAVAVVQILEPEPTAGIDQQEVKRRVRARMTAVRDELRREFGL